MYSLYALLPHRSRLARGFLSELPEVSEHQDLAQESDRVVYTLLPHQTRERHQDLKGPGWFNG